MQCCSTNSQGKEGKEYINAMGGMNVDITKMGKAQMDEQEVSKIDEVAFRLCSFIEQRMAQSCQTMQIAYYSFEEF